MNANGKVDGKLWKWMKKLDDKTIKVDEYLTREDDNS